jgi:hypothetical protein
MKFFGSRIITKSVSMEDAIAKAKEPRKVRSLDEILAEIDAKNKQSKVAAAAPAKAEVKTAAVEAPKAEAPKAEVAKAEVKAEAPKAETNVEVKVAKGMPDFIKQKIEERNGKDGDKKDEDGDKKDDKKDDDKKEKEAGCMAGAKLAPQKWAKSLDFRQWEATDVVRAWEQHGGTEKCASNVKGKVSDPKVYCELLKTASEQAGKMIKAAESKGKAEKKGGVFKKIAKLTDDEKSWLADYYRELYGEDYVSAMLADY